MAGNQKYRQIYCGNLCQGQVRFDNKSPALTL
jgi:hypothetical protein